MAHIYRETKSHGQLDFPYQIYHCKIPQYFTYYPMHWHEEFEIIYILEGKVNISVQSKKYLCEAGDVVLIPPDYIHEISQFESIHCRYFNMLFDFSLLENQNSPVFKKYFEKYLDSSSSIQVYLPKECETTQQISPYLMNLFNRRHESAREELLVKSDIYAILFYIQKLFGPSTEENNSLRNLISRVKPVIELAKNDCQREISVKEAASLINVSESHFMNIFKKVTGYSFINYLKLTRLEKARNLLIESTLNISEISDKCGFMNLSYFIRSFKARYEVSPLQYRKWMLGLLERRAAEFARNAQQH